MSYLNLAREYTYTTGTGTVTLGGAVPGCKTFALAGAADSAEYSYGLITYNLTTHRPTGSEVGTGKYIAASSTFQRTSVENSTDSDDSAIDLTGLSEIYLCPIASTLNATPALAFASYYQGDFDSVPDSTDNYKLNITGETADPSGIGSFSSDDVTISSGGWYQVTLSVAITAGSPFNGYINVNLNDAFNHRVGYATAMGIQDDIIQVGPVLYSINAGQVFFGKIDNHLGETINAWLSEYTFVKLGDSG